MTLLIKQNIIRIPKELLLCGIYDRSKPLFKQFEATRLPRYLHFDGDTRFRCRFQGEKGSSMLYSKVTDSLLSLARQGFSLF